MSAPKKFVNAIPAVFAGEKAAERAERKKLAAQRADREMREIIAQRWAGLKDALEIAQSGFSRQCETLQKASEFTPRDFALHLIGGYKLEEQAIRLAGTAALKSLLPEIQAELEGLVIAPAKKALQDFERANKAVIKKLPKIEKADEPPFRPPPPVDDDVVRPEPPSRAVRMALGIIEPAQTQRLTTSLIETVEDDGGPNAISD